MSLGARTRGTLGVCTAFVVNDSNRVRWSAVVLPSGDLDTNIVTGNPSGSYVSPTPVVLQSATGNLWQVTVLPSGNLDTVSATGSTDYLKYLLMSDSNGRTWTLTVTTNGNLGTN